MPGPPLGVLIAIEDDRDGAVRGRTHRKWRTLIDGRSYQGMAKNNPTIAVNCDQPGPLRRLQRTTVYT
jgi:hypothetical protein